MPSRKFIRLSLVLGISTILARTAAAQAPAATPSLTELEIADKARIALEKLPYYGPFDLIGFDVHGSTVTLYGWAYQAVNKDDAAIYIIVKGGKVALYGTVNSDADKIKAGMDAHESSASCESTTSFRS